MSTDAYEAAAQELKRRILELIPANPGIMSLNSAWDLFDVPGFDCKDIGPSYAQAMWALGAARNEYRARAGAELPTR